MIYRPAPWVLSFRVEGHGFPVEMRFMASGGGNAKYKALPKLQGELMAILSDDSRNPRVKELSLKKVGGRDFGAPVYTLCRWCSSFQMLMKARKSSRVFKIKNNGHGGNGRC